MTRLLKIYEEVKIISVKKISDMSDENWKWRNGLVAELERYICIRGHSFTEPYSILKPTISILAEGCWKPKITSSPCTPVTQNTNI